MLLQFSVENYLSFDTMTHFSMRASDEPDHPSHVLKAGKHQAVRGAAIYGANAAGKSNLVKAMGFARDLIVSRKGTPLREARPFRLGDGANRPSGFHWQWIHADRKWSYGFDIQRSSVIEEYLFAESVDGGEEQLWFERKTDENGVPQIELGPELLGDPSGDDARLLQLLAPRTPDDELLLHRCRDNGIESIFPLFEWFEDVLLVIQAEADYQSLILEAAEDERFSDFLSEQMKDAGTGVMQVQSAIRNEAEIGLGLKGKEKDDVVKTIGEIGLKISNNSVELIDGDSTSNATILVHKDSEGKIFVKALFPMHKSNGGKAVEAFRWEEESEGTQRYLHLLPRLYRLQTRPTVLVIDELERRLHTHLTRRIVEQGIGISPLPESQLIFTTHDTNLLDNTLLRRDEIWFVDKNENGASSLFSLAQFKDFDSPNYEQAYLMGLFEAIPYFRNSHQLSPALRSQDETPVA